MKPQKQYPCNRICDCAWGSKTCVQKRGYIWNYVLRQWSRDEYGNIHRTSYDSRECKYVAPEQMRLF